MLLFFNSNKYLSEGFDYSKIVLSYILPICSLRAMFALSVVFDYILSRPISDCYFKNAFFEKILFSKIDKAAFVNSYADTYLNYLSKKHNKKLIPHTSDNSLVIKSFSLNIKRWLKKFRGIASKYL